MKFAGIQKTTLLDYPGKVAATVFTYGCNFRCPFCHNPELVNQEFDKSLWLSEEYILNFFRDRRGKLDAFVVTGGEPLMHPDLIPFLEKIKDLGFLVKVDTNGTFPERIQELLDLEIVDYWAMDIKNSEERYLETAGLENVGAGTRPAPTIEKIRDSIYLIINSGADYEFRTTVVPGLHNEESMHGIGELINRSETFYIQNFRAGKTLDKSYSNKRSFSPAELQEFKDILEEYVEGVGIRGDVD